MKRSIAATIFLFWTVAIIGAYYVVQKPDLIPSLNGIALTLFSNSMFVLRAIH